MQLATDEFICRFLIHVLADGFHRIRHYGLLASSRRKINIAKVRILLGAEIAKQDDPPAAKVIPLTLREPCPDCGGEMRIIEIFKRGQRPQNRHRPERPPHDELPVKPLYVDHEPRFVRGEIALHQAIKTTKRHRCRS